ncbi:MAG TPA: MFS transporter [Candidatus Tidjanibacter faecipullorum]|uniref:MFS transporter n=1 Tax=Candidatus Tidjanibacter faecipullorum TaxID=2838766 RepID=A0A9D2DE91_9BACT|nr:MFS transporter [Candidatus Tidjanibacter faecipullorum]
MKTTSANRTFPIAMMFALFFIIAFVTGLQNPMGVIIKSQFQTSHLLSQLGNLANFIAYAFMGIPAGWMLGRIGYKRTSLTAIAVGLLGVVIMWLSGRSGQYGLYLTGAFVSGFSMCMLNTVVNPMLKTLGRDTRQGNQLIQFGGAFNSIGATLAPILVGYLMGSNEALRTIGRANPALYIAMAIFAVTFVVIAFARIPEPHLQPASADRTAPAPRLLRIRHFALGLIAIFLYVGTEVGIPNIANLFMTQELHMDASVAGTIVGTYWLLMLVGRLLGGAIGNRISVHTMLAFTASLGLVLVGLFMLFSHTDLTVALPVFRSDFSFGTEPIRLGLVFLILCGLATSVMWGAIFSLATTGLGQATAQASGIFMTMVCGGGILPALQAWIADRTSFTASFGLVLLCLAYLLFYALRGYRPASR